MKEKKVLITGGVSGIGRSMAALFASHGAEILLLDINAKGLDETAFSLKAKGAAVSTYQCDLSNSEDIYRCTELIKKEHKFIDVLINNAGVVSGKNVSDLTDQDIEMTISINLLAHFRLIKSFLPGMIERNSGHIVTISSAGGMIGTAGLVDYAASKFAVFGLDESLRADFHKKKLNINTTVVCPFYINTGMFDGVKTRFSFLLPILDLEKTAARIVKAVIKKKKRLYMPWIVYLIPVFRLMPVPMMDFFARFLGVHDTMNEFKGRKNV